MTGHRIPEPDEVTAEWWAATSEHTLLVQRCDACGHLQHPPRALCTGCGRTDALGWQGCDGSGVVDAATMVHVAPSPELTPPYVVARVRLADTVILLAGIDVDPPGDLPPGTPVRLTWRDLPDGRALPMFTPATPTSEHRG